MELIANAGTYGPKDAVDADEARGWLETFAVNTVAPYLLAKSVLPAVERSRGKLIAISSKMGSIDDNSSGGYLAYRSSKTALNSAWRNLAHEVRRAIRYSERPNRFLYGSDWPLAPMTAYRELVKEVVPPEHHECVYEENARRLFRIG